MKPKRIQRKRTRGWKMPENTVCVTRPGRWGNPYRVGDYVRDFSISLLPILLDTPEKAVAMFRRDLESEHGSHFRENAKKELRGKNLACFCPLNQPCHADVLLEIANA